MENEQILDFHMKMKEAQLMEITQKSSADLMLKSQKNLEDTYENGRRRNLKRKKVKVDFFSCCRDFVRTMDDLTNCIQEYSNMVLSLIYKS